MILRCPSPPRAPARRAGLAGRRRACAGPHRGHGRRRGPAGAGHEHGRMGCAAPHAVPAGALGVARRPGAWTCACAGGAGGRAAAAHRDRRAFLVRLLSAGPLRARRFLPRNAAVERDSVRRVDVLVSRLRSKARRLDIDLPVLAVGLHPAGAGRAGGCGRYRDDQIVPMQELGSVMLPRMRAICDEGWRRMRRVSAAE